MNPNLTEIAFILDAIRRLKQGANDVATLNDAAAPLESLREEEEGKSR